LAGVGTARSIIGAEAARTQRLRQPANAASLGAHVIDTTTRDDLQKALEEARRAERTTVIVIEVDKEVRVPGYESWWDVPVAEVSEIESVKRAREGYDEAVKRERNFF